MTDDYIKTKRKKENIQKQKAKELSQIVKKAMPIAWKITEQYDKKEYSLMITIKDLMLVFLMDPDITFSRFEIEPVLDDFGTLRGVSVYPHDEEENNKLSGYNMSKRFAKKFEEKYLGQYTVEIKPK